MYHFDPAPESRPFSPTDRESFETAKSRSLVAVRPQNKALAWRVYRVVVGSSVFRASKNTGLALRKEIVTR